MVFVFVSPKTHTRKMAFLGSLTDSARWYIRLLSMSRSQHRDVPVYSLTRSFDSSISPVSCPLTDIHSSRRSFGNPCSDHSAHVCICQHLTIQRQMVRRNRPAMPSKKYLKVRLFVLELERIHADSRVRHQQLGACVNNAYTVLRECLAPSTTNLPISE